MSQSSYTAVCTGKQKVKPCGSEHEARETKVVRMPVNKKNVISKSAAGTPTAFVPPDTLSLKPKQPLRIHAEQLNRGWNRGATYM